MSGPRKAASQSGGVPRMALQLREAIGNDGRSLNRLAKATGVDSGRLPRFMRGERDLNLEAACRICDALGVEFVLPAPAASGPGGTPKRGRKPKAEGEPDRAPRRKRKRGRP